MRRTATTLAVLGWMLCAVVVTASEPTNTFTVAAYNLENWLSMERDGRPNEPKPADARDKVAEIIASIRPDVLGVAELGTRDDLADLLDRLRKREVEYPHREWIESVDTARHVGLLSRFPIVERYSRTDYTYQMGGRTMRIQRGILDVKLRARQSYTFRAIMVHLKSKRAIEGGDQNLMRREEARLLREHVGKALKHDRGMNLIVMGDMNDTPDSEPVRMVIGTAPFSLFDLNPVSHNGYHGTYYHRGKREFSRIDYLLASPGMLNEYVAGSAQITQPPGWFEASDHLAVSARFLDHDIGELLPQLDSLRARHSALAMWLLVVAGLAGVGVVYALIRWRFRRIRAT